MRKIIIRVLQGLCLWLFLCHICEASTFTLKQAEHAALSQSPEIKALQSKASSLKQSAVAVGQLSDPKLMLGAMNVPVDTFSLNQEPMTQLQVGLQQDFPRGHSLRYRSLAKSDLSHAELYKQQTEKLQILRSVRVAWLSLYYWLHARTIIIKQKIIFQHLVSVTESMLANNKAQQKDVVRAQLEVTELNDRLLQVKQETDTARSELSRWVGPRLAKKANPTHLPSWSKPPNVISLRMRIRQHPILKTDGALISSGQANVQLAKQQYIPGFSVGVAYGFRQGRNFDDRKRADFLTAQVSMDLPLFTRNRQDRTLAAREDNLMTYEETRMSNYRQLNEILMMQYATWQEQRSSAVLYHSHLIPEARHYAEATLVAYQNAQTDFPTLARAYVRELNTELSGLKAKVNQDIARANLLYLQGM